MGLSDSPTSHGSALLVSSSQPGRCSEGEGDDPPLDPRLDENNDLKRIGTDAFELRRATDAFACHSTLRRCTVSPLSQVSRRGGGALARLRDIATRWRAS